MYQPIISPGRQVVTEACPGQQGRHMPNVDAMWWSAASGTNFHRCSLHRGEERLQVARHMRIPLAGLTVAAKISNTHLDQVFASK